MHADERLRINTPEQVALELPVAGIGSRFLAVAVDTVLQLLLALAAIVPLAVSTELGANLPALLIQSGPAVAILFVFCVYWGYFAFFELFWSGRTPGKRLAHIRVVKESGRAINAYEAISRNILRAVDFLPAMYGLGVIVMMFNKNSRRIGDYVAGTVVVYDRRAVGVRPHRETAVELSGPADNLARMTAEELVLIESYLQRRGDLAPLVRDQMAERIADRIEQRTGLRRDPDVAMDDFLESVVRRIRDTRFR